MKQEGEILKTPKVKKKTNKPILTGPHWPVSMFRIVTDWTVLLRNEVQTLARTLILLKLEKYQNTKYEGNTEGALGDNVV